MLLTVLELAVAAVILAPRAVTSKLKALMTAPLRVVIDASRAASPDGGATEWARGPGG